MGNKIKIFIVGHKEFSVPKSDILIPIQAGADINGPIEGLLKDNEGDNISSKNAFYSELTAQYYAIKNEDADYYGFFHYRRYLNFSSKTTKRPYVYYLGEIDKLGDFIGLNEAKKMIENYDILLPRTENFHMTVREQYGKSLRHTDKEAFQNILDITKTLYPDYAEDIASYIDGKENYLGNMYIMNKELANQYFDFLYNIFKQFDSLYKDVPNKTQGFLSERLFGVFFNHMKRTSSIKYKYLQRVDVLKYYDKHTSRRLIYFFLPPSSRRRALIKAVKFR